MAEKNVCKLCLIFNIHKTQSFDAPLPLAFGLLEEWYSGLNALASDFQINTAA